MLFNIAGPKIFNEYNNLKQSKQEVNINKTSKKMDEYVYDKNSGLKNLGIIGGIILSDILSYDMIKNDKIIKNFPKFLKIIFAGVVSILNIYAGKIIYDAEKAKQMVLNNPQEKLKLYKEQGFNAVI